MTIKASFGLQPHHIATIERILDSTSDRNAKWEEIGKEIGWEQHTACEWYIRRLQRAQRLQDDASEFVLGILPALTYHQQVKKVLEEATELAKSPNDETEYADVLISLLVAWKLKGGNVDSLLKVAIQKMKVNRNRKWGETDENGLKKHL